MPDLDNLRPTGDPCPRHNEIPIYGRPWRRLFRKTNLWVCIKCNQTRRRSEGIWDAEKDVA